MGSWLFLNATRRTISCYRRRLVASRIILLLLLTLLLTMPVTEHVWHGDELLRGGHDVELCLLGALTFCGLVALAAEQVSAPPLLSTLLGHKRRRLPMARASALAVDAAAATLCRWREPTRCIDLRVPVSLLSLRI